MARFLIPMSKILPLVVFHNTDKNVDLTHFDQTKLAIDGLVN